MQGSQSMSAGQVECCFQLMKQLEPISVSVRDVSLLSTQQQAGTVKLFNYMIKTKEKHLPVKLFFISGSFESI